MPNFTKDRDEAILWARQIMEQEFLILDTETTGLGHDDEAVAIGLIDHQGEVLLDTLLRHTRRSEPGAEAVHGITWEMTRDAPLFAEVYPKLEKLKAPLIIGYNLSFDLRIIRQTCQRYEVEVPRIVTGPGVYHDIMRHFAEFYGAWNDYHGSYTWQKLERAAAHFGLDTRDAHGAVADAQLTLGVVRGMAGAKLFREVDGGD